MRALGGLFAAVSVSFLVVGCRTPEDVQRDYARKLTPDAVRAAPAPVAEGPVQVRLLRVRVWADEDYQREGLNWQLRIGAIFDRANRVLGPQFAVQLDVVELKPWDHLRGELVPALQALAKLDPGEDVDWVVGFIGSQNFVARSHEDIGRAFLFGRHIVLRGMLSLAETDAIHRTLSLLSTSELDRVTRERRAHKETAVLLHEWAHTLGVAHERAPDVLMSPVYDSKASTFSAESIRLAEVGLRWRGAKDRTAWLAAYADVFTRTPPDRWDPEVRKAALDDARAFASEGPASAGATGGEEPGPRGVARRATALANRGDVAGAWSLLEPAAKAAPDDVAVQGAACDVATRKAPRAPETLTRCSAAAALPGAEPELGLLLAWLRLERKEPLEAYRSLLPVDRALAARATVTAETWVSVAQLYAGAGGCTAAERTVARVPETPAAKQVLKDCRSQRRRVGLPRQPSPVDVDREPEYVAMVREAQAVLARARVDKARTLASTLEREYPRAPGAALVRCLAEGTASSLSRTRDACGAAVRADPEAIEPHYWLGLVALEERRTADARRELGQACELDETSEIWGRSVQMLQRAGDTQGAAELREKYRQRFGRALATR